MGRFTDEIESKGFLKELLQKLQTNLNGEQVKNFANLDTDEARFRFVVQDPNLKEFTVSRNESIKNIKLALDFKQKGNNAFQSQDWKSAMGFYNKGLLLLPAEHGECTTTTTTLYLIVKFWFVQKDKEFSILLANRSAALYHMERYDHALQDIELAEETYPAEMMYKLKERSARCFLAKKSYENALYAFRYVFGVLVK